MMHLVLSEAGMESLATAGISTGWLAAWLCSAGAEKVQLHMLETDGWKEAQGSQLFLACEADLMRVALHHGHRIRACEDGSRDLVGTDTLTLENPTRRGWHYPLGNGINPPRAVLLPLGDIAYQRGLWLSVLSDGRALLPLYVRLGDEGGMALEPGLRGALSPQVAGDSGALLNDGGFLPEEQLCACLRERGLKVRFAESCTGGGMSERLSRLPGASDVLDRGWVTYSNTAKHEMLGVPQGVIEMCGAVSRETVEEMAEGGGNEGIACVAISGIAGPGGGSEEKPVGTVWIAASLPNEEVVSESHCWRGSRAEIRRRSINAAMGLLIRSL